MITEVAEVAAKTGRGFNFNSFLNLIAIACIFWVGEEVLSSKERMVKVEQALAVMAVANEAKLESLNRIEAEVNRQRDQLHDLQLDVSKLKNK
jgi:hypothetical protein